MSRTTSLARPAVLGLFLAVLALSQPAGAVVRGTVAGQGSSVPSPAHNVSPAQLAIDVMPISELLLDGQVYDVSLTMLPPVEPPTRFNPSCTDERRPFAFISKEAFEAMTFQFGFAGVENTLSVSLALANLTEPMSISTGSAVLSADADADTFTFSDLATSAGASRFWFRTGRIRFDDSDADGLPDTLGLSDLEGEITTVAGDVIDRCSFSATGEGGPDTTPPSIFFGTPVLHPFSRTMLPCRGSGVLLADSSFDICFSELVQIDRIDTLINVVDSNGLEVPFLPVDSEGGTGVSFSAMGFWPLGQDFTVTVLPGFTDRAGNRTSQSLSQSYRVVDDPSLLDNFSFETGDFSGFTVLGDPVVLTESFLEIQPTDGRLMAIIGSLNSCGGGTVTARLVVPQGASHLSLDHNSIVTPRESTIRSSERAAFPILSGSLRYSDGFRSFRADRPMLEETMELTGDFRETGWRHVDIPVADLAGQEVVMTLKAQPGLVIGPPPLCIPGVLLLDNLRFDISGIEDTPAAIPIITRTGDSNDGICGADCSLREAIAAAGSGDTIVIPTGTYTLTLGTQLVINKDLILTGTGADSTIIQAAAEPNVATHRVLDVTGGNVAISGVTIRHGKSGSHGGGIRNAGRLTLANTVITRNFASLPGAGILNRINGMLTVIDSTIRGNSSASVGGGVYNSLGTTADLINSTVSANVASEGAGIYNIGTLTLTNTTLSDNSTQGLGGGVYNFGIVTLTNSTVTTNVAFQGGGAVNGGLVAISRIIVENTVIAGNIAPSSPDCRGSLTSLGHNLIGSNHFCSVTPVSGDLVGTPASPIDPLLGPLRENGGPTSTHAILPGSPAIDAGDDAGCPVTDQRGETRPVDGDGDGIAGCDMGAYELATPESEPPASQVVLDQVNDPDWRGGWTNLASSNQMGQTFIPMLPVLVAVEVGITTGNPGFGGDTLTMELIGIDGELLVTRSTRVQDGFDGWLRFDLPRGGIRVPPGKPVELRLRDTGKPTFGWKLGGDYPSGTAESFAYPHLLQQSDFLFRTYGRGIVGGTAKEAAPRTITVTTTDDTRYCGTPCSLRGAISLADPGDEIIIPAGVYTLALHSDLSGYAFWSALAIDKNLTLTGEGSGDTVIQVNNRPKPCEFDDCLRAVFITGDAHVVISGVTIRHGTMYAGGGGAGIFNAGTLSLTDTAVRDNYGGGIWNAGTLTLTNSTIRGNLRLPGCTRNASVGYCGFGISNRGTSILVNSTVSYNTVVGIVNPGVLFVTRSSIGENTETGIVNLAESSIAIVMDSVITANSTNVSVERGIYSSDQAGGGIRNQGRLIITNGTISDNSAVVGGGIHNDGTGTVTMTSSTVSNNTAVFGGGGINNYGRMTLTNTTVSGNRAAGNRFVSLGGGISNEASRLSRPDGSTTLFTGVLTLINSTVSGNIAEIWGGGISNQTTADLVNTIIAGNSAPRSPDCSGPYTSQGHNLIGTNDGCSFAIATGDLLNVDPHLGPLQDNGGPTFTHALLSGSPAIDAGDNSAAPTADQRGVCRPQGTASDIGSYELEVILEPIAARQASFGPSHGSATVDGVTDCEEWSGASVITFEAISPDNAPPFIVSLRGMNDATDLYIGITINDEEFTTSATFLPRGDSVRIDLDNDRDGVFFETGDDAVIVSAGLPQFQDLFSSPTLDSPMRALHDAEAGGAGDGIAAASRSRGLNHFEIKHPLCSGDPHDFCLRPGDVIGFRLEYLDGEADGTFGGKFFVPDALTDNVAEIVIALREIEAMAEPTPEVETVAEPTPIPASKLPETGDSTVRRLAELALLLGITACAGGLTLLVLGRRLGRPRRF